MERKHHFGFLVFFIFLGFLIGGAFSEILGALFSQINELMGFEKVNPIYSFFVTAFEFNFGMAKTILNDGSTGYNIPVLDLHLIKIPIAFGFKINICAVFGMVLSLLFYNFLFLKR